MTTAATQEPMPGLAQPGQKVRWRNLGQARAWGWEAVFGPGPFEVVQIVDHSKHGLAKGLVLPTLVGKHEVPEVWLAAADAPDGRPASNPATVSGS